MAAWAALSTQVKTPRCPDSPLQPHPQELASLAGCTGAGVLDTPLAARREITDSTTERSVSGSRFFIEKMEWALSGTSRAALAEKHELALTRADRVDRDDGVLAVLEFGRVFIVHEFGTEQEKFPSDHELVFFRGDYLSDDFC